MGPTQGQMGQKSPTDPLATAGREGHPPPPTQVPQRRACSCPGAATWEGVGTPELLGLDLPHVLAETCLCKLSSVLSGLLAELGRGAPIQECHICYGRRSARRAVSSRQGHQPQLWAVRGSWAPQRLLLLSRRRNPESPSPGAYEPQLHWSCRTRSSGNPRATWRGSPNLGLQCRACPTGGPRLA